MYVTQIFYKLSSWNGWTVNPFLSCQNVSKSVILTYRSTSEAFQHKLYKFTGKLWKRIFTFFGIYLGTADGSSFIASSHQSEPE